MDLVDTCILIQLLSTSAMCFFLIIFLNYMVVYFQTGRESLCLCILFWIQSVLNKRCL